MDKNLKSNFAAIGQVDVFRHSNGIVSAFDLRPAGCEPQFSRAFRDHHPTSMSTY